MKGGEEENEAQKTRETTSKKRREEQRSRGPASRRLGRARRRALTRRVTKGRTAEGAALAWASLEEARENKGQEDPRDSHPPSLPERPRPQVKTALGEAEDGPVKKAECREPHETPTTNSPASASRRRGERTALSTEASPETREELGAFAATPEGEDWPSFKAGRHPTPRRPCRELPQAKAAPSTETHAECSRPQDTWERKPQTQPAVRARREAPSLRSLRERGTANHAKHLNSQRRHERRTRRERLEGNHLANSAALRQTQQARRALRETISKAQLAAFVCAPEVKLASLRDHREVRASGSHGLDASRLQPFEDAKLRRSSRRARCSRERAWRERNAACVDTQGSGPDKPVSDVCRPDTPLSAAALLADLRSENTPPVPAPWSRPIHSQSHQDAA